MTSPAHVLRPYDRAATQGPFGGSGAVTSAGLTVGDVADRAGIAPSAVRFYEERGVIEAHRTSSNQRRFDDSAVPRIQIAKLAQRVGLTVREIAELFADMPAAPRCADWSRVADHLVAEAQARMTDLTSHVGLLTSDATFEEIGTRLGPAH
ncbi:MerR family redox-sensitive transcriptional activator SoxR [Tamaricihabitans halophyticus]|uniref:MerR family redox-sensitive transcriptional activator SoxR n=1 Tax=Tamaricihabitans halophyticus TaxID=1262583 RepID=A0A4R2R3W1_9PSEU|nr:MerR family DNA-binding transcriptional regulator [Tamaricihabitans halophyticus]TCP57540.1 MerR family redox-sensitive transcriptional activator SoxR [Tamaricihabitans halophyticus]